jgi:hypothetical protein
MFANFQCKIQTFSYNLHIVVTYSQMTHKSMNQFYQHLKVKKNINLALVTIPKVLNKSNNVFQK